MSDKEKILIVEDEKLIRWSIRERLQREGYHATAVETGRSALDPPGSLARGARTTEGVHSLQGKADFVGAPCGRPPSGLRPPAAGTRSAPASG